MGAHGLWPSRLYGFVIGEFRIIALRDRLVEHIVRGPAIIMYNTIILIQRTKTIPRSKPPTEAREES